MVLIFCVIVCNEYVMIFQQLRASITGNFASESDKWRDYLEVRVVDIRQFLAVCNFFLQMASEHPRACLNGMSWNPAISNQAISSGSRHLIVGDSLVRDLNEILVNGQTTVLFFGVASMVQALKMMEFQSEDQLDTLIVMLGINDISRTPITPESRWEPLLVCHLSELKEKYKQRLVVLWAIPHNQEVGTSVADFKNGNVTRWNEMTRNLVRSNPGELRFMNQKNTLRMTDYLVLTRDRIPFNTLQELRWINDAFQTKVEEIEKEFRATDYLALTSLTGRNRVRSNVPEPFANRLGPLASDASGNRKAEDCSPSSKTNNGKPAGNT